MQLTVDLKRINLIRFLRDDPGDRPAARTNLQHSIGRIYARGEDYFILDILIDQKILA